MLAIYRFEDIGEDLELVPLAARRALDGAGLKISLEEWRSIALAQRRELVECGASETIDRGRVRSLLGALTGRPLEKAAPEPDRAVPPESLATDGVSATWWASLRALDRWALASLARRGRDASVHALRAELSEPR
jgi:hypothetical protein